VDPVNFFLLSTQSSNISLKKSNSCGLEHISEAYRWDFRLYTIFVGSGYENETNNTITTTSSTITTVSMSDDSTINTTTLAYKLGGDVYSYSTFKSITSSLSSLVSKLSQTTMLVSLSLVTEDLHKTILKLYPCSNSTIGYPVPEKYFIDVNTEHVSIRAALPHLTILNRQEYIDDATFYFKSGMYCMYVVEIVR
jgi:hypothetical protein